VVLATVVGIVEWIVVFNHSPDIVIPNKTFEQVDPQSGP
jgi:hypothetical protein